MINFRYHDLSLSTSSPGLFPQKMGGAGKGKSPGDEVFSLFNLLDFVIYLFIYLFFEEPIVETKKVVHFNIFTSCMVIWIE